MSDQTWLVHIVADATTAGIPPGAWFTLLRDGGPFLITAAALFAGVIVFYKVVIRPELDRADAREKSNIDVQTKLAGHATEAAKYSAIGAKAMRGCMRIMREMRDAERAEQGLAPVATRRTRKHGDNGLEKENG